eukprot:1117455-Prymnesium_polylepis.1
MLVQAVWQGHAAQKTAHDGRSKSRSAETIVKKNSGRHDRPSAISVSARDQWKSASADRAVRASAG